MAIFLQIIVGLLVAAITYWWIKMNQIRSKLKWIPEAPRVPILGNILEFKKPIDIIYVLAKYLQQYDGLCTIELGTSKIIVTSNPTFLEFLLGGMAIINKSDDYKFFDNWLGTGLLTSKAPKWKKTRKMLTPSFHFSILDSFIEIFERNGDTLIKLLEKETSEESVDIFPYITMTSLDIICEAAMGVSINAQENPQSAFVHATKEKCRLVLERSFSNVKSIDFLYALTADYYKEMKYINILHSHTLGVIRSRKEELKAKQIMVDETNDNVEIKKKKMFLDLLLDATIDGRPLTDTEIREEVDTFMFAGHDTTAAAVSFALYCLSLHKDVQDQLFQEQKRIFGDDKNKSPINRYQHEMKYLELTMKETLRLYPSVPFIGRKANKDVEYKDGNVIPAGTQIFVMLYTVNRNPKMFPDPNTFNPSRFENNPNIPPYTYLPFSAGPRNCIGQKFAWNMMKSVISKVLRNYEILPCGHEIILSVDAVLNSQNGMRVKLRKRNWNN